MNNIIFGVVENRHDPLMLGRVQVRLIGLHSDLKQGNDEEGIGIPTEDLPWAMPLQSITSAAMNGIGSTPTGMVEGSHVICISRDELYNDLIIMGTIGGIPQEIANGQAGFNDPNGIYPKETHILEPDTNRLSRNEKIEETIHKTKVDSLDKDVERANALENWNEPQSTFNPVYPYNHVTESESGHIAEIDDTEGAERTHEYNKSGTFTEIDADGNKVTRIVGDDYLIIQKDNNIHIQGNCNITVEGDASILVHGNVEEQVKKNVNRVIEGNITELVKGSVTRTIEGSITETVKSNKTLKVSGTDSETIGTKSSTVSGSETNKAGSYSIDGAVNQTGGYVISGDVVSGGVSLETHKHLDTAPGSPSPTSEPI